MSCKEKFAKPQQVELNGIQVGCLGPIYTRPIVHDLPARLFARHATGDDLTCQEIPSDFPICPNIFNKKINFLSGD